MQIVRAVAVTLVVGGMAFAFQVPEDPVLKARTQRAQAQGISDGDLPPVPRTITEPPPLPAPEMNYKDTRKAARASRSARATKGRRATKNKVHATVQHRKTKPR